MPRVHTVKKARKPAGSCGKCGKTIAKGESYYNWKFRYGGKRVRHTGCGYPRQSELTSSDKLSRCYAAGENIEAAVSDFREDKDLGTLQGVMEESANELREVAEEYRESAQNVEDGMNGNRMPICDELEEKADNLEGKADEIENASGELEEFDPDNADIEAPEVTTETDLAEVQEIAEDKGDLSDATGKDRDRELAELREKYAAEYREALDSAKDDWAEEQASRAEDVTDTSPE